MVILDPFARSHASPNRGAVSRTLDATATRAVSPLRARGPLSPAGLPLEAFAGIDTWPVLDVALRNRSIELAKKDLAEWSAAGGVLGPDGQPAFGSPSAIALELASEVVERHGCFRYRDAVGTEWALLVYGEDARQWKGLAIGCAGRVDALAPVRRMALLKRVQGDLAEITKPGRRQTDELLRDRARLSRKLRWLTGLDAAITIATSLYDTVDADEPKTRFNAESMGNEIWGESSVAWPDNLRDWLLESLAMLAKFELRIICIRKTGWNLSPFAWQPAISDIRPFGPFIHARFSSLFIEMLSKWRGPNKHAN